MEIAIHETKGKLSGLIKAAMDGEQVLLTKHGRPVAEIKPFAAAKTKAEKLALLKKVATEDNRKALPLLGFDAVGFGEKPSQNPQFKARSTLILASTLASTAGFTFPLKSAFRTRQSKLFT